MRQYFSPLKWGWARTSAASLTLLLLLAVAIRLWLIPRGGLVVDIVLFKIWGEQLASAPLDDFYRIANPSTDYLPGFLYILAVLERLRAWVLAPTSMLEQYIVWVKLPSLIFDLLLITATFGLARGFADTRQSVAAAALVAFNPGLVFVSAVWGQADSIGCALSLLSFWMLISGNPIVAAALGGLAFLTKPQYSLFLGVAGVAYLRRQLALPHPLSSRDAILAWAKVATLRILFPLITLIATLQLTLLPFSVSLWPGPNVDWTIRARLIAAGSKFPVTSLGAFNLWGTPIAGMEIPDTQPWLFSLSYQVWGLTLFTAVALLCLALAWRRFDDPVAVLWSCFVISLAFFILPTRIHERYLFVAIPLIAIITVLARWVVPFFILATLLYFVNVLYGYAVLSGIGSDWFRFIVSPILTSAGSISAVLLLICSLVTTIRLLCSTRKGSGVANLWH